MQIKFFKKLEQKNYTFDECLIVWEQGFPDIITLLNIQLWFFCFSNYKAADSKTPGFHLSSGYVYFNTNTETEIREWRESSFCLNEYPFAS